MKPGPKGKSTEQHRAEGTLRSDRHASTPLLERGRVRPEPSAHLSESAREQFEILVDELWEAGILDGADRALVELAAIEAATIAECNEVLDGGLTQKVVRGGYNGSDERTLVEVHPLVSVRERAMKSQAGYLDRLGIGPAARAGLANSGVKGRAPKKTLPGVGAKPSLKVVKSA